MLNDDIENNMKDDTNIVNNEEKEKKVIINYDYKNNEHIKEIENIFNNFKDIIDIKNNEKYSTSTISEDNEISIKKYEEPWSYKIEELLRKWKYHVEKMAEIHDNAGYLIKTRYYRISIPTIVIPFLMTFLSQAIPEGKALTITNGVMFLLTSAFSGLRDLFGYAQLYEKHFSYSAKYSDISTKIDSELYRKKAFRIPADVLITEIKCKIDNLTDNAPELPMEYC